MGMLLWVAAVILAIMGIFQIIAGNFLWGIILLVVAAAIGPGGYSVFRGRSTV